MQSKIIYITGVSSSGKTTIGKLLSKKTGIPFFDGDDFHPAKNIAKMEAGQPLNDGDRQDWLESINIFAIKKSIDKGAIIACSALKEKYRLILKKGIEEKSIFIFLNGDFKTIKKRMEKRTGHYMPVDLLQSQFDDLENPDTAIAVDIRKPPEEIVEQIIAALGN